MWQLSRQTRDLLKKHHVIYIIYMHVLTIIACFSDFLFVLDAPHFDDFFSRLHEDLFFFSSYFRQLFGYILLYFYPLRIISIHI